MKIVVVRTPSTDTLATRVSREIESLVPEAQVLEDLWSLQRWDPCVVVVPYAEGLAKHSDRVLELQRAISQHYPILVVPPTVANYQPGRLPADLRHLSKLLAVGLDAPESLRSALRHHLGLEAHGEVRVFISYSWHDGKDLADELHEQLRARHLACFQDQHELTGADEVQREIERDLARRDVLVVVDTPKARESKWVREEIIAARALRVPVVVVGRERSLQIDGVRDASYIHCESEVSPATIDEVEKIVRRVCARRSSFTHRAQRAAKLASRALHYRIAAEDDHWLHLAHEQHVVHLEATSGAPEPDAMLTTEDNARDHGAASAILVAGEQGFPARTQRLMQRLTRTSEPSVRACPVSNVATSLAVASRAAGATVSARVMLSAAMPEVPSEDSQAADELLYALISSLTSGLVMGGAHVVFGGHPSITPVVHETVLQLGPRWTGSLSLHQLRRFRDNAPPEAFDEAVFGAIEWSGQDLRPGQTITAGIDADLGVMRDAMVRDANAAVLIGGKRNGYGNKPGIRDEFDRFRAVHPTGRVHLVGLLGGATQDLIDEYRDEDPDKSPIQIHEVRDPDLVIAQVIADLLAPSSAT